MNNCWHDELTDEQIVARIEEVLRGKADGKGYTVEELDAYFRKSRQRMKVLATKEDFRKGFDRVMHRLNKLLAMATDMVNRMELENAEWLRKQQAQDKKA
jgi:hypothetical protein